MLEAALEYEDAGYAVIPISPGKKHPPLVEWKQYQQYRPTREQVRQWWTTYPNANIAILTGAVSNLSVVDFDGEQGQESFLKYLQQSLPASRIHATPRGRHLFLKFHPELTTGAGFLPGVDVRSEGGYVIAPPSVVDGNHYTVFRDREVAELSFVPPALTGRQPTNGTATQDPVESLSWVSDALLNGVDISGRNQMAARLIGYFTSKDIPIDIVAAIMDNFAERCRPPMNRHELQRTIESVTRYRVTPEATIVRDPYHRLAEL